MTPHPLSQAQLNIANLPLNGRVFVQGAAGAGKTTAAAQRLRCLIENGVPAHQILVIVPQRTLAQAYYEVISQPDLPPGSVSEVLTMGGLAQRMTQLFWPLVAEQAGFARPDVPPTFLNAEHAQYYMACIVKPLMEQDAFKNIPIERNRLYSQILSNLNSAASVGFDCQEIGVRLKQAWVGEAGQLNIYDDVQKCATQFRQYCLAHNLLDFSLALEIFRTQLWDAPLARQYRLERYRHLIYDNSEEDVPVAHDLVAAWLPDLDTALVLYDTNGGHRSFLGADSISANALSLGCEHILQLEDSFVTPPELDLFDRALCDSILRKPQLEVPPEVSQRVRVIYHDYLPEMVEAVIQRIRGLVYDQGIAPGKIAILSPFLSDSLRFTLTTRLDAAGIAHRSHRPSRALRDEPAARCLLSLSVLAYPHWKLPLNGETLRAALMVAIADLDLPRAHLLANNAILTDTKTGARTLKAFHRFRPEVLNRIGYYFGQDLYENLRLWIEAFRLEAQTASLDVFLSRLFGEVLSQPGYGFYQNYDAASAANRLIESVQTFRRAAIEAPLAVGTSGQEYVRMVQEGVIGSQFLPQWLDSAEDAVFIAPAFTFLVSNRCAEHQFWLDIGAPGWAERLDQPLTHAQVLRRDWPPGEKWNTAWEQQTSQTSLARLVSGLVRRCSGQLYLFACGITENGEEHSGDLLRNLYRLIQKNPDLMEPMDV